MAVLRSFQRPVWAYVHGLASHPAVFVCAHRLRALLHPPSRSERHCAAGAALFGVRFGHRHTALAVSRHGAAEAAQHPQTALLFRDPDHLEPRSLHASHRGVPHLLSRTLAPKCFGVRDRLRRLLHIQNDSSVHDKPAPNGVAPRFQPCSLVCRARMHRILGCFPESYRRTAPAVCWKQVESTRKAAAGAPASPRNERQLTALPPQVAVPPPTYASFCLPTPERRTILN